MIGLCPRWTGNFVKFCFPSIWPLLKVDYQVSSDFTDRAVDFLLAPRSHRRGLAER